MDIERLTKYIETVWTDERSSFDQKRNKTTYAIQQHLNQAQLQQHSVSGKRPYFQVSRNDYGKPFFFYKPSTKEGTFNCWMPVDEEFEREFNEMQKAACASGAVDTVAEARDCGCEKAHECNGRERCKAEAVIYRNERKSSEGQP